MTVASVTPSGGAITTDSPPSTLEPSQGNSTSLSASAPSNRLRKPLYDTSLNTLNIPPTTLTFSNNVSSVDTSCSTQSSYTPPILNTRPVSVSPLSVSWDGRYKKLQQMSLGAATLLTFLCLLHPDDIPEVLFCRMWSTRECWNCEGEIEHVNVSVDIPLVDVLTRQTQFNENIQLLESFGFIKSAPGALGKRKFSIKPDLQDRIVGIIPNMQELEWLRLVLICHSFPGRVEELGSVSDTLDYAGSLIICSTALQI